MKMRDIIELNGYLMGKEEKFDLLEEFDCS